MVNAEFNWWLLIAGLVVGAGLAWLVLADLHRSDEEIAEEELESEAAWIVDRLAETGRPVSAETVEAVLRAHRGYRSLSPAELDELRRRLRADGAVGPEDAAAESPPPGGGARS